MMKYDLKEELDLVRSQLNLIDIDRLQNSELKKDPRELEKSYAYPGPIPYENQTTFEEIFSKANLILARDMSFKLYVHLPFCERRCSYCFYESEVMVDTKQVDDYLMLLTAELDMVLDKIGEKPKTSLIYLGGGTPNYLTPKQTDFLLGNLESRLERLPDSILCIENHPHLVTEEHAKVYARHRVNRISLGMQSFVDRVQREIGRFQQNERATEGYQIIRGCQTVKEINMDVIYGFPGQSIENWFSTLEKLIELKPEETTVYHFKLHPNSPFFHQKNLEFPQLEQVLLERLVSMNVLKKEGYVLTRPHHHLLGGRSLIKYQRAPGMELGGTGIGFQLGIGCSAYSHIGEFSFCNLQRRKEYSDAVGECRLPFLRGKKLDDYEKKILFVLGNLCNEGRISKTQYHRILGNGEYDKKIRDIMHTLSSFSLVETLGDLIKLTNPAGVLWYEEIARQFYPEKMKKIFLKETGRKR